jgi:predicted ribosome quality control (RQC) complex YloA/Tae2 family protein
MEIKISSPIVEEYVFQVSDDISEILLTKPDLQDELEQRIKKSALLESMKSVKAFKPSIIQIIECNTLEECFKRLGIPIKHITSTDMCMLYKDGELTVSAYKLYNGLYYILRLQILCFLKENQLATQK